MIKKIWNDPVWSKVIAVGIVALITIGYTKFLSISEDVSFNEAFSKILEIKISVIYALLVIVAYSIILWLVRKIFKKEKDQYNTKKQILKQFNKIADDKTGILFKWNVYFDNDTPFISEISAFCTKHGEVPIKFTHDACSIHDCENSRVPMNKDAIINYIESLLIDKWEKIK